MKQGDSKTFKKRHQGNRECVNIANLVKTKVAKLVKQQLRRGKNHLLAVKKI